VKLYPAVLAEFNPERIARLTDPAKVMPARGDSWRPTKHRYQHEGYVYVLRNTATGDIKIGFSRNVLARLREIDIAHSRPVELLAVLHGGETLERALYLRFAPCRLRGEWFEHRDDVASWLAAVLARCDGRQWVASA
jgi:hypothetical protein